MASDVSSLEKIDNPWLRAFLAEPWNEIVLGQVLIRRGFELRHVADREVTELRPIRVNEVRLLANYTMEGKFRPLKSTPDLASGWILKANTPEELESALQDFYPNAVADIFAIRKDPSAATDYRTFTNRQTGMYRITTFLDDEGVARVIGIICNSICLKRRIWSVGKVPNDAEGSKSLIPCLEPCAIFMEAARKEVRALQEKSARSE
jgi:hypothetical protein